MQREHPGKPGADSPMARIHPHGWRELLAHADPSELPPSRRRRLETLARLAGGELDDRFAIYHGVHWARIDEGGAVFEDIDFIVVGPGGRVLLIEQAPGFLDERPDGLVRRGGREVTVATRLGEARARFEGRLRRALGGGATPSVEVLFHCPDYTVRDGGTAGLPPERIVDAARRDALPARVRELVDGGGAADRAKLHRFLLDLLGLVPDAGAVIGDADALATRLSGGLAEWARRIDCAPFRLRVVGTAGSGKTQLAVAALRDGAAAGRRALYVCYNRPLADHVAAIAGTFVGPRPALSLTFHQLADRVARQLGAVPDFAQPDAFARLERTLLDFSPDADWRFDELIVDEGQDFHPAWAEALLRLLAPDGRAWWLEDPTQNLYGRVPFRPAGWVELRADTNFRSPKAIARLLARLVDAPLQTGSPIDGAPVEVLEYGDATGLLEQTKRAIGQAIAAGFRRETIAVLSFRGRERSRLAAETRLGPYALRAFTGRYDLLGAPVHSDGDVAFDSVLRFKGRSAPCVVLSEIDFDELDEAARRRLFVGASRATLRLTLVAAARCADKLAALLGEAR